MSVNVDPIFVATPRSPGVRLSSGSTALDGSAGSTLFTAGANGAFFKGVKAIAEVTTTAGWVAIFKQDAASGNVELLKVIKVDAFTVGATIMPWEGGWFPPEGIALSAGTIIKAIARNSEAIAVHLMGGGDY